MIEVILGVPFLNAPLSAAMSRISRGGLMVVPSAPMLASLPQNEAYRRAVEGCDFALVDSAYLALLWYLRTGKRLNRVSGLEFIRAFLAADIGRAHGDLFLVNPTDEDTTANLAVLRAHGFDISIDECYTAPVYNRSHIEDPRLAQILAEKRPRFVLLNVGGGVQEPLGLYLKSRLTYEPAIICTGAAIAFVSGRQASIPPWADRLGLGWLVRCIDAPRQFVPRYARSLVLAPLLMIHGRKMPPPRPQTVRA